MLNIIPYLECGFTDFGPDFRKKDSPRQPAVMKPVSEIENPFSRVEFGIEKGRKDMADVDQWGRVFIMNNASFYLPTRNLI